MYKRQPSKVFTKNNIFESVWNENFIGDDNAINVHIGNLRKKFAKILSKQLGVENKEIQIEGDDEQQLICDMEWTGEAIGNIVKNALDHTQAGGIVRITDKPC